MITFEEVNKRWDLFRELAKRNPTKIDEKNIDLASHILSILYDKYYDDLDDHEAYVFMELTNIIFSYFGW